MSSLLDEILTLCADLRSYFHQEWELGHIRKTSVNPSPQSPSFSPPTPPLIPQRVEKIAPVVLPPIPEKIETIVEEIPLPPPSHEKRLFELSPPPIEEEKSFVEMQELFERLSLRFRWQKTWSPFLLVWAGNLIQHQSFVQNFAKALTDHFAYCQIVNANHVKDLPPSDWLFAPTSFFGSDKQLPFHQVYRKKGGRKIFALAEYDRYLQDPELKRSLWNLLKNKNFLSSQLSS